MTRKEQIIEEYKALCTDVEKRGVLVLHKAETIKILEQEPKTNILEKICDIINIDNRVIQEDAMKYKMICDLLKKEGMI